MTVQNDIPCAIKWYCTNRLLEKLETFNSATETDCLEPLLRFLDRQFGQKEPDSNIICGKKRSISRSKKDLPGRLILIRIYFEMGLILLIAKSEGVRPRTNTNYKWFFCEGC